MSNEVSRENKNSELLKYLLKYNVLHNDFILEIPVDELINCIKKVNDDKIKIINIEKFKLIIENIREIIIEIFRKMDFEIIIEYIGYINKIILNKLNDKIINIKYKISEIIISNIEIKDNIYILKDSLSDRYYSGINKKYIWDYKKINAEKINNLDYLAKIIVENNFTNIKLINYSINEIGKEYEKEENRNIENSLLFNQKDIDWYNSFEYSHWKNMAHNSAINNWLKGEERSFLMNMGKYKQDKKTPTPKQLIKLKNIYKEYKKLIQ